MNVVQTKKRKRESAPGPSSEAVKANGSNEEPDQCAVCLDIIDPGTCFIPCRPANKESGCAAKFCKECLETWKKRKIDTEGTDATCPTCRKIIEVCPREKRYVNITSIIPNSRMFAILQMIGNHANAHNSIRTIRIPVINHQVAARPRPPPVVPQRPPDGNRFFTCKTCRPKPPTSLDQTEPQRHFAEIGPMLTHIAQHHPRLRLLELNAEGKLVCIHHRDEVIEPTIESVILHYTSHGHDIQEIEQRIGVKLLT